jgi:uncharacterized protein YdaU (DUF1376 family)
MPFYIGDYLRDTGHLTAAEHGCYMLLITQAWPRSGLLPLDEERLRLLGRMTKREWKQSRETILAFFTKTERGYRQKRVDKEIGVTEAMIDQRKAAGKASAKAREERKEVNGNPTERPTEIQRNPTPSPSPSPSPKESNNTNTETQSPRARALSRGGGRATPAMPNLNSPWSAWEWLTGGEVEICGANAQRRPCAGGFYVDEVARIVADAAGFNGFTEHIDWRPLVGWLRAGYDSEVILHTVRRVASQPDYEPKIHLNYFTPAFKKAVGKVHA